MMVGRIGSLDQMRNNDQCFDAETQRRGGHAEQKHFSAGCVSGLCADASSSPAAKRPASREITGKNTTPTRIPTVLYFSSVISRETPSVRARCVARVSALRSALFVCVLLLAAVAH